MCLARLCIFIKGSDSGMLVKEHVCSGGNIFSGSERNLNATLDDDSTTFTSNKPRMRCRKVVEYATAALFDEKSLCHDGSQKSFIFPSFFQSGLKCDRQGVLRASGSDRCEK